MQKKFGPTRSEVLFRIWFSVVGIGFMIALLLYRGIPSGPAAVETFGIGSLFFGGSLFWNLRKLIRKDYSDAL